MDSFKTPLNKAMSSTSAKKIPTEAKPILLEDFSSKLIITSMYDSTGIKNSIAIDKSKKSIKSRPYPKIIKPKVKPIQYSFWLFLGMVKLKDANFVVFVDQFSRNVHFLRKYHIYEIKSVVYFNVETSVIDKELSDIGSKLMSRGFFFSYDVDLTLPINETNALSFKERRNSNWLLMTNYNFQNTFFTYKTCEWVIPVVFGDLMKVKLNIVETESDGKLWILKKISIMNIIGISDTSQFFQNVIGTCKISSIEIILQVNEYITAFSINLFNAPFPSQVTTARIRRFAEVVKSNFKCSTIFALIEEEESQFKKLEAAVLQALDESSTKIIFENVEQNKDFWSFFVSLFNKSLTIDAKKTHSTCLLIKDVDVFCEKRLSFLVTIFLFSSKILLLKQNNIKKNISINPINEHILAKSFEHDRLDSDEERARSQINSPEKRSLNVFQTQEDFWKDSRDFELSGSDNLSKQLADKDLSTLKVDQQRNKSVDKRSNSRQKRSTSAKPVEEKKSIHSERIPFYNKSSNPFYEEETSSVEEKRCSEFLYDTQKFQGVENLINLKITKILTDGSMIAELNSYFKSKPQIVPGNNLNKMKTMKSERYLSNQDKTMHKCRQLSRTVIGNFENVIAKLKTETDNPHFRIENLTICLFSLNLSGLFPTENDFKKFYLLNSKKVQESDIVVLCFQETILMKASNLKDMVMPENDGNLRNVWIDIINNTMNEFEVGFSKQLCGLMMFFLTKKNLRTKVDISLLDSGAIKLGAFNLANKGCIYANFKINHQKLMIVNCHLAAGIKDRHIDKRLDNLRTVLKMVEDSTDDQDISFVLGDMNFRVNKPLSEVNFFLMKIGLLDEKLDIIKNLLLNESGTKRNELAEMNDPDFLKAYSPTSLDTEKDLKNFKDIFAKKTEMVLEYLKSDELTQVFSSVPDFDGFENLAIKFMPTYRFYIGKDSYDMKDGKRIPSFTDRIMISKEHSNVFSLKEYDVDWKTKISDHRPIYMFGTLKILSENIYEFGKAFDKKLIK